MKNALGYLAWFAAFYTAAMPSATPERIILHPVVHDYAIAESFGCDEVGRTCRAKVRDAEISKGVIHGR